MATRIRIKTDVDNLVHFDISQNDYTLCGLETAGDERLGIMPSKATNRKVNCPDCIRIVKFCHLINKKEFNQ